MSEDCHEKYETRQLYIVVFLLPQPPPTSLPQQV